MSVKPAYLLCKKLGGHNAIFWQGKSKRLTLILCQKKNVYDFHWELFAKKKSYTWRKTDFLSSFIQIIGNIFVCSLSKTLKQAQRFFPWDSDKEFYYLELLQNNLSTFVWICTVDKKKKKDAQERYLSFFVICLIFFFMGRKYKNQPCPPRKEKTIIFHILHDKMRDLRN